MSSRVSLATVRQTTNFTCGPAALMTALQVVCPDYQPAAVDEFLIWREANTVFMGQGHPGCGPYGLALAAVRRGAQVTLWLSHPQDLFAVTVLDPYQRQVMHMTEQQDLIAARRAGVIVVEKSFLVDEAVSQTDCAALLLVKESGGDDYHWITLVPGDQGAWMIFDPDQPSGFVPVRAALLDQRLPDRQAILFLRRP